MMRLHVAGHSVGLLMFFFGVAAISRILLPVDKNGQVSFGTGSAAPATGVITGGANALSNLFTNTLRS